MEKKRPMAKSKRVREVLMFKRFLDNTKIE
jgi:hypothetical protein